MSCYKCIHIYNEECYEDGDTDGYSLQDEHGVCPTELGSSDVEFEEDPRYRPEDDDEWLKDECLRGEIEVPRR